MSSRPIKDILNTGALRALGKGGVMKDRRGPNRYSCRVPAVMTAHGKDHPVECLDISEKGIRLSSLRPVVLQTGQKLAVKIRIGNDTFEDSYTFIRTSPASGGASLVYHLRLEE